MPDMPSNTRTDIFLAACDTVLTEVHLAITTENNRRTPHLPLPDNFLFGIQSVESELYPLCWEVVTLLTQPQSTERAIRMGYIIEAMLKLGVYHRALTNTTLTLTKVSPLSPPDTVVPNE